jgi:hypothetical protein
MVSAAHVLEHRADGKGVPRLTGGAISWRRRWAVT